MTCNISPLSKIQRQNKKGLKANIRVAGFFFPLLLHAVLVPFDEISLILIWRIPVFQSEKDRDPRDVKPEKDIDHYLQDMRRSLSSQFVVNLKQVKCNLSSLFHYYYVNKKKTYCLTCRDYTQYFEKVDGYYLGSVRLIFFFFSESFAFEKEIPI